MIEIFDTHCHLHYQDFDADRDAVFARARAEGVVRFVAIGAGGGLEGSERAVKLSESEPGVWASVGVHPLDAALDISRAEIEKLAQSPRVVAIGETGLDYYKEWAPRAVQEEVFKWQIELAKTLSKPIVIHSRDAGADCLRVLTEYKADSVGGVFHCFSEDAAFAAEAKKINFLVSIPGVVTFKKNDQLRAIVKEIPLEQLMVETDAPYLAPEPFRGKRCESAHVRLTAEMVAKVKGVSLEELASITTENALRLFKISR